MIDSETGTPDAPMGWRPGHFYSPIPSLSEVEHDAERLFGEPPRTLTAIDLNERHQLRNAIAIADFYPEIPYRDEPNPPLRFGYRNDYFSYGEAIVLYGMLRSFRPEQIIEIGSGYSSAAILDANEVDFQNSISCTFIEPYPDRLYSLINSADERRTTILKRRVQDVEADRFAALGPGDILFVDSSHVSKIGSDVNYILFEVLPRLKPGVFVHFHDIGYPFEYPKAWIHQGRAWNEAYMLRAFLQYNTSFSIEFFNAFLARFHARALAARMPLFMKSHGSSLWLRS